MRFLTILGAALLLAACASETPDETPADDTDNAMKSACPVYDSRDWAAWIDAEPPGPAQLHIRGEVDLPTPGYTASWRMGIADRAMPPGQHVHLDFKTPDGMVAQVITSQEVAYKGDAAYEAYRVIRVHCGDKTLAEITEIPVAR